MKSPISSGRPRKLKPLILRRVVGDSMLPTLKSGQLVIGVASFKPKVGRLVIVEHKDKEIVKRLTKTIPGKLYISGDNPSFSSDSRQFGWIDSNKLLATVIWPKKR